MSIDLDKKPESDPEKAAAPAGSRTISIPLTTLLWSAAVAVPTIVAVVLAVLLVAARDDIAHRDAVAADHARAEQIATDYAVGASTVNFADFTGWVTRLKNNTAPALATKFDSTAPALQEILTPLKWTSTALPITARVVSESGGVYKVNVFVNVSSTNAQNPQGAQTTVTYNVTVDRGADWKVTDVGGMEGALPLK
ncbi:hypothetical protein [Nocardia sp. NPDC050406]|uniref:hypothetical protein n=1 Tax=Nocardia sp. NPDC050406 TaxID=3364318 RepID=UPI0037B0A460